MPTSDVILGNVVNRLHVSITFDRRHDARAGTSVRVKAFKSTGEQFRAGREGCEESGFWAKEVAPKPTVV